MVDRRVTDDTAILGSAVASGDLFDLVDVSDSTDAATGTNKKILASELATAITTLGALATDAEVTAAIAALSTVYQPLDSDLTAIAALSTTSFGRALLILADAAALRTSAGLGTAATKDTGTGTGNVILGDDARLTDSRTPSGSAGGVLGGTYPNPSFASDMATQAELDAEAALARNADNLSSGTVADARIASTIARDSEVTSAVSTHAGAVDPHGDRAYADGLASNYDDAGAAAAEVAAHEADTTSVHGIADTSALVLTGDARLTDSRAPSGSAGGDLAGTYPNPTVLPNRLTLAYALWMLISEREFPGVDPTTVDWETIAPDFADGGQGTWIYAIQWPSFHPEILDGQIITDSGTALAITKNGPIMMVTDEDVDGIAALSFLAGDPSDVRYDVIYLTVTDVDTGAFAWGIWRGTPGVGKDDTAVAFLEQKGALDMIVIVAAIPVDAASWDDCDLIQTWDDDTSFRRYVQILMAHGDLSVEQEFQPVNVLNFVPGSTGSLQFNIKHGETDGTWVFTAYISPDGSEDAFGLFGGELDTTSRPTIDPGAISGNETAVLTDVVNMLIALGVVIDGS